MRVETLMNYRAGRAVRRLANRSDLRKIRYAHFAGSGLRPPTTIPQPRRFAPLWRLCRLFIVKRARMLKLAFFFLG